MSYPVTREKKSTSGVILVIFILLCPVQSVTNIFVQCKTLLLKLPHSFRSGVIIVNVKHIFKMYDCTLHPLKVGILHFFLEIVPTSHSFIGSHIEI